MRKRDSLLAIALRLQKALVPISTSSRRDRQMLGLLGEQRDIDRLWRMIQKARWHGWHLAAAAMQPRLQMDIERLYSQAASLIHEPIPSAPPFTLRSLLEDLRQLQNEFEELQFDAKPPKLTVQTDGIELEGRYLGPFAVELRLDRLEHKRDISCFDIVALEPNPPTSQENVTHPHVRDKELCAGDATEPISSALRDGRIADAFILINNVLHTYHPHSPYVSLADWDGVCCSDCGYSTSQDNLYACDHCDKDYCESCSTSCDICGSSCCQGCLDRDPVSENQCCPNCRATCAECGRTVESGSFVEESQLCPECDQAQTKENDENQPTIEPTAEAAVPAAPVAVPDVCAIGVAEATVPVPQRPARSRRVRRVRRRRAAVC